VGHRIGVAVELAQQPLDQRGLARAHLAGDDDEAFALGQSEGQVRDRPAVSAAAIEEAGIRGELKGRSGEVVVALVHG
jgi:hypothetical protein